MARGIYTIEFYARDPGDLGLPPVMWTEAQLEGMRWAERWLADYADRPLPPDCVRPCRARLVDSSGTVIAWVETPVLRGVYGGAVPYTHGFEPRDKH
ncbi:hypothetical protein [Roseococcus pinisoli]|uniref:Uncharacterized protein n=1 Tax=Roseococcus pinisoli TaxID=2835040 RepID=A0ABS5Q7W4_9PROT|nr:hypothetical protein [Roseococcus pinisoli]MBS7809757.1 hypothetical protein [Roseococcus pinisoli]